MSTAGQPVSEEYLDNRRRSTMNYGLEHRSTVRTDDRMSSNLGDGSTAGGSIQPHGFTMNQQ